MTTVIDNLRELRLNGIAYAPEHGETPTIEFSYQPSSWRGGYIGIAVAVVATIVLWIAFAWTHQKEGFGYALSIGTTVGTWVGVLYYVIPVFSTVFFMVKNKQIPSRAMLNQYSSAQRVISFLVIGFAVMYLLNHIAGIILSLGSGHPSLKNTYITSWWHYVVISIAVGFGLNYIIPRLLPETAASRDANKKKPTQTIDPANAPFGLWVGRSTGYLLQLWHRTGLAANQEITLSIEDAAQNILVLGGIGSGKTTRLMQPLLAQLLDQGCGGLLFDVKGDVRKAVDTLTYNCNREVVTIGPNHDGINLLAGLTPETAASFLKSALLLSGGSRVDSFWIDTATELCRNTLGVLSFLPQWYNLHDLYNYLFDEEFRDGIQAEINPVLVGLEEKEQRLLKSYLRYHDNVFATFDDKVKSGVNATIAQALSPFNHPELTDAFCSQQQEGLDMTALLDGMIFLVDMPLSRWGAGAKVAYTFIKLCFFNMMQNRIHHPEWDQNRPVFFMCDEYQDLISASKDGLSDLNFWDKSRSSKTIGIISSQSVSSFYAAIGDHDLAHAVIQNFRQKFCFRTEDRATLTMMNELAGQARVQRVTYGQNSSSGPHGGSEGSSQSVTESREAVLDATLFRQLGSDQVIELLSVNGHGMDDLFNLMPIYIQ